MRRVGSVLWPKLRVLQVYGATTGVGKTVFCSLLCRAFRKKLPRVNYLKPVSTGPLDEADDRHISSLGGAVTSRCLYQFDEPVSPHIAARSAGRPITDAHVLSQVDDELRGYADGRDGIAIVETAGGVLSPSPSGSSQADLYRPLRLPTLLVGDHHLGGIGTTISAWESLHIRGYDVSSVALFSEDRYGNHSYLQDYFRERKVNVFAIPPPPARQASVDEDRRQMQQYYEKSSAHHQVDSFTERFLSEHDQRVKDIRAMPAAADQAIWHPFMQHSERSKDTIVAWDSAYGDDFQSYSAKTDLEDCTPRAASEESLLKPAFDGSASWWTQGLGHGNPKLALTAANAAGRYGHVMFGNAIHQPALDLAQTVIARSGNPKLAKVFYSDNGSTGMEVAVKMALRAAQGRWKKAGREPKKVRIIGLKNSYHGDTIGTMDCSEPSIYNKKVDWYTGRGIWLDFPTIKMRDGKWHLVHPGRNEETIFDSLSAVFDLDQRNDAHEAYKREIRAEIGAALSQDEDIQLGALIIEPILLGAGGMLFCDPLYQKCLVEVCQELYTRDGSINQSHTPPQPTSSSSIEDWTSMPIIFDEVFTGLYRLGRFSAGSFLNVHPDIVVNAKLLTGGLLPLCTTTASDSIFHAFLSPDKTDALLHGHSYTAHPIGCAVANESLRQLTRLDHDGAWEAFQADWRRPTASSPSRASDAGSAADRPPQVWSMWSRAFVASLSRRDSVDGVFALGSVLAIHLTDPAGRGYASTAATGLRDSLLRAEPRDAAAAAAVIHSRVLGNVLYLMASMTTREETLRAIEDRVSRALT